MCLTDHNSSIVEVSSTPRSGVAFIVSVMMGMIFIAAVCLSSTSAAESLLAVPEWARYEIVDLQHHDVRPFYSRKRPRTRGNGETRIVAGQHRRVILLNRSTTWEIRKLAQ